MEDYLQIVVVGDVDSGKSTLIGRFLYDTGSVSQAAMEEMRGSPGRIGGTLEFAYLLDSLEEERKGQLTIDTTEAFCKTEKGRQLIFIDVPGHRELIKNMLCGSSYADTAILVVDVRKSIEEQTKRHAFILKFLGIGEIILALNKMDSVNFSQSIFDAAKVTAVEFFKKIGLHSKHCIPVSAKEGEGLIKKSRKMPWYKGLSLSEALDSYTKIKEDGDLRFPIQDIYSVDNEAVAVGNIVSGGIKRGQKAIILPLNKECIVKKIRVFGKGLSSARAPQSIGVSLDEMSGLNRSQVICGGKLPQTNNEVSVKIFCVRPLDTRKGIRFRCATQESLVHIKQVNEILDSSTLEPKPVSGTLEEMDMAKVVLAAESDMLIEKFKGSNSLGRCILEVDGDICAVGVIL